MTFINPQNYVKSLPKRMKWHFRDSRFKISRGRIRLDTLRGLTPLALECPFQDFAPAAFQSFRRPWASFTTDSSIIMHTKARSYEH
jgi:hypothetical protein